MLRAAETTWRTDTGRQRRDNEDSALARAPVFVVADGMGGAQAGEVASRIAIEAFEQGLPDPGSPEERLALRAREANRLIHEHSRAEQGREGMGTTLTAAYLHDAELAIAHVGDSRAYLFRDGSLGRLTKDHTLVGALVDEGKLTEEQAAEHPQRSIITRALGPEASVEVDTWSYPVRAGDVLLLCSDGLTSMISDERIAEILSATAELGHAADDLIAGANEAGGRDNITVVLTRLEDAGAPASPEESTVVGLGAPRPARGATAATAVTRPVARAGTAARSRTHEAQAQGASATTRSPVARRTRRHAKPLAALVATLIVLFLVGGGGWLATRQLYFIGTNPQAMVTIYRGLPYDLPAGIRLYETFYVSGVPAQLVPADRRGQMFDQHLRSQSGASALVRDLELGKISR